MGWKEEVFGTAGILPSGTELVVRSAISTESVVGQAMVKFGGALVKTVAGVPMAVVGQEVGQRVGVFPKTREEAVARACGESESWRETVSKLFEIDPQYRRVGVTPIVGSELNFSTRRESLVPRHGLIDKLARELVGASTFVSVGSDLNTWMGDVFEKEATTKERTEADRLEDSISDFRNSGQEVGFGYLVKWLRSSWRQSRSEMWAGLVVNPFVSGVRNERVEQVLNSPVPLARVKGKDLIFASIAGGSLPALAGVLTGGVDVEIRNDRIVAGVGKERRTIAKVGERDIDVGDIADPIEMVSLGQRQNKLSKAVDWGKSHRVLPKVRLSPLKIEFFPKRNRPTEVLPAAEVKFGSLQQDSQDLRLPVYDAPGVRRSVEETVGVYQRLRQLLLENGGRKSREELRRLIYASEEKLKEDYVPRPEVVIRYSPSATRIWIDGPDMDSLFSRLVSGGDVSGLEAKRAVEMMENKETGEAIYKRIKAAYGGDGVAAGRGYRKIVELLRNKLV